MSQPEVAMTIEERAKEIYMHGKVSHLPWSYQFVLKQITQACAGHYKDREAVWKSNMDLAISEAREEENARCRIILDKMIDKSFTEVFSEAIERAAKVAEAQKHFDDAGMIRALRPGEK